MNRGRSAGVLLVITLLAATITTESSAAGRSTSAIVNTILNGRGAPKSSLGIDGDFYIDTRSLLFYGPKTNGKWSSPTSLQGPTGPAGSDGRNGSDGKSISNISAVNGAQGSVGPQGEKGEKGERGEKGEQGVAGPQGVAGVAGANGSNGAQGPQGLTGPVGPQGPQGLQGPQGVAGADGAVGPQGPKGDTGTSLSSEVTVIDIPSWILSTGLKFSFSDSSQFGTLLANHNYQFWIHIEGVSAFTSMVLGFELLSPNTQLIYSYSRNDFRYATYSDYINIYAFDVIGTVAVGSSNSGFSIRIIDGFADSNSKPLTLTGKAYITSVGAIK